MVAGAPSSQACRTFGGSMRNVLTALLLSLFARPLFAQGAPPQVATDQPYTMEYYYKTQWGHQRVVVLEEQLQELLLVPPLRLVVVLHRVGLVGGNLGRSTLGEQGPRE